MYSNDATLYDQVTDRMKELQREAANDRLVKSVQSQPRPTMFSRLTQNAAAYLKLSDRPVDQQPQMQQRSTLALQNRS